MEEACLGAELTHHRCARQGCQLAQGADAQEIESPQDLSFGRQGGQRQRGEEVSPTARRHNHRVVTSCCQGCLLRRETRFGQAKLQVEVGHLADGGDHSVGECGILPVAAGERGCFNEEEP